MDKVKFEWEQLYHMIRKVWLRAFLINCKERRLALDKEKFSEVRLIEKILKETDMEG